MSISRQSCQEQTSGLLLQFLTRIYFPKSWPPCFDFGSVDFNGNTNKDSFSSITVNVEGSQEVHRESWHPSPDRLVQKNSRNLGSKGKGQSHTWRLAPWFLMTCSLHCAYLLFLLVFKSFTILQPKNMTPNNRTSLLTLLSVTPSLVSSLHKHQTMCLWSPPLLPHESLNWSGLCTQHFAKIA